MRIFLYTILVLVLVEITFMLLETFTGNPLFFQIALIDAILLAPLGGLIFFPEALIDLIEEFAKELKRIF